MTLDHVDQAVMYLRKADDIIQVTHGERHELSKDLRTMLFDAESELSRRSQEEGRGAMSLESVE